MGCKKLTYSDFNTTLKVVYGDFFESKKLGLNYYPFGQVMPNRHGYTGTKYRYGFQDQEVDDELKGEDNSVNFEFRMYDPRLGRFLTRDPKELKYPNISPYVFLNDMPIWAIDPDGRDIVILSAPDEVGGLGHAACLIGNDKDGWVLYSKNGTYGSSGASGPSNKNPENGVPFNTLKDFANSSSNFTGDGEVEYKAAFRISTNKETDEKMKVAASNTVKSTYNVISNSCIDVPSNALAAAGLDPGFTIEEVPIGVDGSYTSKSLNSIPNVRYGEIKRNNAKKGKDVSVDIRPDKKIVKEKKEAALKYKKSIEKKKTEERVKRLEKMRELEKYGPKI